jgi:two-component system, LuxR family, sensor kinase FixL
MFVRLAKRRVRAGPHLMILRVVSLLDGLLPGLSQTARRLPVLLFSFVLLVAVVTLEYFSHFAYSLGILYVFPVMVAALVLNRFEVIASAVLCAFVRGLFTPGLPPIEFWLRFTMAVLAYSGIGLLVGEISRHRRTMSVTLSRLELEQAMRHKAEAQLRELADSSPAAILTLDAQAMVLMANRAAHELLGFSSPDGLIGVDLSQNVPLFAGALRVQSSSSMRTSATGWASRNSGERFPVATWFSTYGQGESRRLAGILVDTSEEVRERERETFRHVYDNNRLFASAVSHEIRNLCSAIRVVNSTLARQSGAEGVGPDLRALGALVDSLARIASFDLRVHGAHAHAVPLDKLLGQLRLVIEPDWADLEGSVALTMPPRLSSVHGDESALLQVFLNLSQNALRAVQPARRRELKLSAHEEAEFVCVRVEDSGPGVTNPASLFQPFREGSEGTGLGLFISRNITRSFGGELLHVPVEGGGACFEVRLRREASPR